MTVASQTHGEVIGRIRPAEADGIERALVDLYQHGFPLTPRPYAEIAQHLGVSEAEVLAGLGRLRDKGALDRIGPVIAPNTVGASTLAAMAVPALRLDEVARLVSGYAEVNHNYEREHRLNLWFVAMAPDIARLAAVLDEISRRAGLEVIGLPLVEAFHIDLGFAVQWN